MAFGFLLPRAIPGPRSLTMILLKAMMLSNREFFSIVRGR